jgi:FkbM family methyltransferase
VRAGSANPRDGPGDSRLIGEIGDNVFAIWKPWYVYRPRQLALRVTRTLRGTPGERAAIALPWGTELTVDPRETIGRSLWTTGIYDVAVSEVLFRLTTPGAVAVDAGANIGYMTSILSVRAGARGHVHAFEPHPLLAERLRENVGRLAKRPSCAPVEVHQTALSHTAGRANLVCPDEFASNQGVGHVEADGAGIAIETVRLDDVLPDGADVMKMDVEGHEPAVLRGAERILTGQRLRHLVFEEHQGAESETCQLLRDAGYTLLQIGWRINGPVIAPMTAPPVCKRYEAPSYLATVDPDSAIAACRPRGWRILRSTQ